MNGTERRLDAIRVGAARRVVARHGRAAVGATARAAVGAGDSIADVLPRDDAMARRDALGGGRVGTLVRHEATGRPQP